ncbi:hypothetical protein ACLKA6_002841 [Drosophila palustris]
MKWELQLPLTQPKTQFIKESPSRKWLQHGHVSVHRSLPPGGTTNSSSHDAHRRIFCSVTLETPPFRLPHVTLTLDLTLLEFFNYTTSTAG